MPLLPLPSSLLLEDKVYNNKKIDGKEGDMDDADDETDPRTLSSLF